MAAGQPYLESDGDTFLYETLSFDPLLKRWFPGGVTGEKPGEGALRPTIRYWRQSPGTDKPRQDGRMGRALSSPTYVLVCLDRQAGGSDKVYGTIGGKLTPRQPLLQMGQRRLYDLLHGRTFQHGGFEYEVSCNPEYSITEPTAQGTRDVQVGWWVRMNVQ